MAKPYTFVYAAWLASYPEFSAVQQGAAQGYFDRAALVWRNDGSSPNPDDGSQQTLMLMLTSHIAALYSQSQGAPVPGAPQDANTPVGRIASAGQGTVNVSLETNLQPGKAAWYAQTKYGFEFWNATKGYRLMKYRRGQLQPGGLGPPAGGFGLWNGGRRWGW